MAYKRSRHRFMAVGDDAVLPPCGPNIPVGGMCSQPPNKPNEIVDAIVSLWTGTGVGPSTYDASLPDCATAPVGAKCNSISAAQAATNASSDSTRNTLIMAGVGAAALLGVYLAFGRKKRSRR